MPCFHLVLLTILIIGQCIRYGNFGISMQQVLVVFSVRIQVQLVSQVVSVAGSISCVAASDAGNKFLVGAKLFRWFLFHFRCKNPLILLTEGRKEPYLRSLH